MENDQKKEHQPSFEIADIFRAHGHDYRNTHSLTLEQLQVMHAIEQCRTQALGGHVDVCENGCGYFHISYNSCRNRHCPKCQGLQKIKWVEQRIERLLPTHYFHMVVTLPHELNPLILYNKEVLFAMFFRTASRALLDYALKWDRLGAQIGFTCVLHTWNQDLCFHPHLHIVASGGGLDPSQSRWIASPTNFLVPVKALSIHVRELFCSALQQAFDDGKLSFPDSLLHLQSRQDFLRFLRKRRRQKWVIYCKKPFGSAEQVVRYIGRYTHRIAISNHRLLDFADGFISFKARDNSDPSKYRTLTLSTEQFIRRFLLHVLPSGFVRIRHYGLMASANAKTKLEKARSLITKATTTSDQPAAPQTDQAEPKTWQELFLQVTGIDLTVCPRCGSRVIRKPLSILDTLQNEREQMEVNSS
jgi:hypothetical protein